MLTSVLAAFSLLAVSTSFIGSVVGLTAFASEQISLIPTSANRSFSETSHPLPLHPIPGQTADSLSYTEEGAGGRRKAASYLLVLLPPLACALSSPDAFFWATEVAVRVQTQSGMEIYGAWIFGVCVPHLIL